MALLVRLIRAMWLFGIIFASYMTQLGLAKIFRRYELDETTGRRDEKYPEWLLRRRKRIDLRNARRLLRGMLKLRGVYIKLGQVLSIMGGFLPRVYGRELESLQDSVPPHSWVEIVEVFQRSLGIHPESCFRSMEHQPLAAASLGQVHVARLTDGRKVAVKVLYPGIRGIVRTDMRVIGWALKVYRYFVPVQNLQTVHEALVDLLRRETDYLHEAECMRRMAANFRGEDDILFPEVIDEFTSSDVLTMTFMEGIKITRFPELEAAGIDREVLATRLVQCFWKQLFLDHLFHADPHPGNFLVQAGDAGPKIVILDFGAICEVDQNTIDGMIDVLQGFFEQDDQLVLAGIERIGFMAPEGNRDLLERTVKLYFQKLLKIQDRTAGALMRAGRDELEQLADPEVERRELRALMKSVKYPDGWFYVERASVLLFWLCGQIAPDLDTMQVGFPYIMPLLMERTARQKAD